MLTIAVFLLLQKPLQAILETLNNAFLFWWISFPWKKIRLIAILFEAMYQKQTLQERQ